MPLARVDLRRGTSPEHRQAIADGIYEALRETFGVPEEDRFVVVNEHDEANLIFSRGYLGIERGSGFVIIQLTVSDTRRTEQKRALFKAIVERLARAPGIRPADVFINLVEVKTEDWSFGDGIAQYVAR